MAMANYRVNGKYQYKFCDILNTRVKPEQIIDDDSPEGKTSVLTYDTSFSQT